MVVSKGLPGRKGSKALSVPPAQRVLLVRLAQPAKLVRQALLVRLDRKGRRETRVTLDRKEKPVHKEFRVYLATPVPLVLTELTEFKGLRAIPDHRGLKALLVRPDHKALRAFKVFRASKALPGQTVRMV